MVDLLIWFAFLQGLSKRCQVARVSSIATLTPADTRASRSNCCISAGSFEVEASIGSRIAS